MAGLTRDKRLERAQMRVLFTVPFFAPGVAKLPVTWDETIDTACTDGQGIRWNPKFFDSLPDAVLPTVLCHEVQHCMLGHLWRAPAGCDWETWNIATDHAVNLGLKEFSELIKAKRLADPFPFHEPHDAYCADPKFAGMAEEAIYAALAASKPPKCGSSGQNGSAMPGKGNSAQKNGRQKMPSFGEMAKPSPKAVDQSTSKKLQNDWQNTLMQSVQLAKGRGDLPGSLERLVSELVNPSVPWWELLRSWIREQSADDWDFLAPAMEYSDSGFILPSLKSEKMGPVVFATDTSGSIDHEMLAQFQTEKQNCLDDLRPSKLVDIYCDSRIHKIAEYTSGDVVGKDAPGGGGTDFRPVFAHVEKMDVPPKCIIYLTDLDGTMPSDPGVPCLWVTWDKNGKAPFGEVVYGGK